MAAPATPVSNGYFPSNSTDYYYHNPPHPLHPPPHPHAVRTSHSGHPPHHHNYAVVPQHQHVPPPMDLPMMPHTPPLYHPHVSAMMPPSSPISPVPPSPTIHQTSPSSSSGAHGDKAIRHLLSAMGKLQGVMSQIAERQGDILDRLSLLEQKAGRMDESVGKFDEKLVRLNDTADRVEAQVNDIDDTVGKIDDQVAHVDEQLLKSDDTIAKVLEQVEITAEDSRGIRARVEDDESHDAFEKRLTALMDGVVEKLIGGLGNEIKEIKKMVKENEKLKYDPTSWNGRSQYMGQRYKDAVSLAEEEQKAVHV